MNHCRRCDSDYERPGTCNCFAEIRATVPANVTWYPGWVQYWQCPHCWQWHTGAHVCYGYAPTFTAGTIRITPNGDQQ